MLAIKPFWMAEAAPVSISGRLERSKRACSGLSGLKLRRCRPSLFVVKSSNVAVPSGEFRRSCAVRQRLMFCSRVKPCCNGTSRRNVAPRPASAALDQRGALHRHLAVDGSSSRRSVRRSRHDPELARCSAGTKASGSSSADGIARHILWISNRGARCVTIAYSSDLEAQNPVSRIAESFASCTAGDTSFGELGADSRTGTLPSRSDIAAIGSELAHAARADRRISPSSRETSRCSQQRYQVCQRPHCERRAVESMRWWLVSHGEPTPAPADPSNTGTAIHRDLDSINRRR